MAVHVCLFSVWQIEATTPFVGDNVDLASLKSTYREDDHVYQGKLDVRHIWCTCSIVLAFSLSPVVVRLVSRVFTLQSLSATLAPCCV